MLIQLADGSQCRTDGAMVVEVSLDGVAATDKVHFITVHSLPVVTDLDTILLLGRNFMKLLKINMLWNGEIVLGDFMRKPKVNLSKENWSLLTISKSPPGTTLPEGMRNNNISLPEGMAHLTVSMVSNNKSLPVRMASLPEGMANLSKTEIESCPSLPEGMADFNVDTEHEDVENIPQPEFNAPGACTKKAWLCDIRQSDLTSDEWKKFFTGYYIRERALHESDIKDCKEQVKCFEIRWDSPNEQSFASESPFDFGSRMMKRLSEEQKEAFHKEISKYTDNNWWKPIKTSSSSESAIVFPVVQGEHKTTRVRPVLDCRSYNLNIPKATYKGPDCGGILRDIRVVLSHFNGTSDSVTMITLDIRTAFYRIRLFDTTVNIICDGQAFRSDRVTFGVRYGPLALERCVRALIAKSLQACGNPTLMIRYYLDDLTIIGPNADIFVAKLRSIAIQYGFEFPMEKGHRIELSKINNEFRVIGEFIGFSHLGAKFEMHDKKLHIACKQPKPDITHPTIISKRIGFQLAGSGTDTLLMHPKRALSADLLRRMVNSNSWDDEVSVDQKDWITLRANLEPEKCCHPVISTNVRIVKIWADASQFGYGFIIKFDNETFIQRSRIWGVQHRHWHINRREFYCVLQSLIQLNQVIPALDKVKLIVYSDSKSAIAWLNEERKKTKSIDRICVDRLRSVTNELIGHWIQETFITCVEWAKIEGVANVEADKLSRLGESLKISHSLLLGYNNQESEPILLAKSIHQSPIVPERPPFEKSSFVQSWIAWRTAFLTKRNRIAEATDYNVPIETLILSMQDTCPGIVLQKRFLDSHDTSGIDNKTLRDLTQFRSVENKILYEYRFPQGDLSNEPTKVVVVGGKLGIHFVTCLARNIHEEYNHCNLRYLMWKLRQQVTMVDLKRVTLKVIQECNTCRVRARLLVTRRTYQIQGRLDSSCSSFFEVVSIDLFSVPIDRQYEGMTYILVLIDHFSRFCVLAPLPDKTHKTIATVLEGIFTMYIRPGTIRSDNAREFRKLARIRMYRDIWKNTPSYAPFANGIAERTMSSIRKLMYTRDWMNHLGPLQRKLNNKLIPEVGYSPTQIVFGKESSFIPQTSPSESTPGSIMTIEAISKYTEAREKIRQEVLRIRSQRNPTRLLPFDYELKPGTVVVRTFDPKKEEVNVVKQNGVRVSVVNRFGKVTEEHWRNLRVLLPSGSSR